MAGRELHDQRGHAWPVHDDGHVVVDATCGFCGQSYGSTMLSDERCPQKAEFDNTSQIRAWERMKDVADTADWWAKISREDGLHALEKAEEYGSADLEIMGKAMETLIKDKHELDPESARRLGLEMAIAFYQLGKASRLFGAYAQGQTPSDDTWGDQTIYPMMARRVRETGQWP